MSLFAKLRALITPASASFKRAGTIVAGVETVTIGGIEHVVQKAASELPTLAHFGAALIPQAIGGSMFGKIKLAIGVLCGFVILGLALSMQVYRSQAIAAKGKLALAEQSVSILETANKSQTVALNTLKVQRMADDALLVSLHQSLEGIRVQGESITQQVESLARDNAKVSDYLRTHVPDELRRVLNQRGSPRAR